VIITGNQKPIIKTTINYQAPMTERNFFELKDVTCCNYAVSIKGARVAPSTGKAGWSLPFSLKNELRSGDICSILLSLLFTIHYTLFTVFGARVAPSCHPRSLTVAFKAIAKRGYPAKTVPFSIVLASGAPPSARRSSLYYYLVIGYY
jgi:hypothetical protein